MPEDPRGLRAVYDHEEDQPRRHRRPVADWGVGEDVFDHMPRRRFGRDEHARRGAHERPPRDEAAPDDAPWAEIAPADDTDVVPVSRARVVSPDGRRTVVIGGRPGEPGVDRSRRRPPRTTSERLGARPDRIVAWIVALGILLILIALLS